MDDASTYDAVCMSLAYLWESLAVEKPVHDAREELLNQLFPAEDAEPQPSYDSADDAMAMMAQMGVEPP